MSKLTAIPSLVGKFWTLGEAQQSLRVKTNDTIKINILVFPGAEASRLPDVLGEGSRPNADIQVINIQPKDNWTDKIRAYKHCDLLILLLWASAELTGDPVNDIHRMLNDSNWIAVLDGAEDENIDLAVSWVEKAAFFDMPYEDILPVSTGTGTNFNELKHAMVGNIPGKKLFTAGYSLPFIRQEIAKRITSNWAKSKLTYTRLRSKKSALLEDITTDIFHFMELGALHGKFSADHYLTATLSVSSLILALVARRVRRIPIWWGPLASIGLVYVGTQVQSRLARSLLSAAANGDGKHHQDEEPELVELQAEPGKS